MLISEALKASGHEGKVKIAMDCAASEFYCEHGRSVTRGPRRRRVAGWGWWRWWWRGCACIDGYAAGLLFSSFPCLRLPGLPGPAPDPAFALAGLPRPTPAAVAHPAVARPPLPSPPCPAPSPPLSPPNRCFFLLASHSALSLAIPPTCHLPSLPTPPSYPPPPLPTPPTHIADEEAKYDLAFKSKDNDGSQKKSGEEMAAFYEDLAAKYPIISIEVKRPSWAAPGRQARPAGRCLSRGSRR